MLRLTTSFIRTPSTRSNTLASRPLVLPLRHVATARSVATGSSLRRAATSTATATATLAQRTNPIVKLSIIMSSVAASAIMANEQGMQAQPAAAASASASASAAASTNVSVGAPPAPTLWSRIRSVWIPTSAQKLADAEAATLAAIRGPFESRMVPIAPDPALGGPDWEINTITLRNPAAAASLPRSADESEPAPLVLVHGFGAGAGLWMSNFNLLAHHFPETHFVDMIGWGRSSRVDFEKLLSIKIKTGKIKKRSVSSKDKAAVAAAEAEYRRAIASIAEDFTVDSLERWRVQMGLERITLVGHSMGGYLAASYALKYPDRVSSLILASPIGVPHAKPIDTSRWGWTARQVLSLARAAWWGANITPQSIVRAMGRWGPRPVSGYVTRRFVSDEEREARGPEGARGHAMAKAKAKAMQDEADKQAQAAADKVAAPSAAAPSVAANPTAASSSLAPAGDDPVDAGSIDVSLGSDPPSSDAQSSPSADGGPALEVDDTLHAAARLGDYVAAHPGAFDKAVVAEYLYHICAQPGSGEFAFAKLFDESGFAHKPLIDSLPTISRAPPASESANAASSSSSSSSDSSSPAAAAAAAAVSPASSSHRIPITFLYGTSDWMDVDAGMATARSIRAQGGLAQCLLVSNAGHQLFIVRLQCK